MRLADFQNPLANTLHVQTQQQAGQQLQQAQPAVLAQGLARQDVEQDKTVQQTEEQDEIARAREEAERGARRNRLPRRRAAPNHGRPPVPTVPEPPPKDGIHGMFLDVQA
jgi:hypothetical protein